MADGPVVEEFRNAWKHGADCPDVAEFLSRCASADSRSIHQLLLTDQFYRWQRNEPRAVEEYLALLPESAASHMKAELIAEELGYLEEHSGNVDVGQFLSRFSSQSDSLQEHLRDLKLGDVVHQQERPEQVGRGSEAGNEFLRICGFCCGY